MKDDDKKHGAIPPVDTIKDIVAVPSVDNIKDIGDYVRKIKDDPVHSPDYYMLFPDMETVDAIVELLTPEEFVGYCKGNILKYRMRAGKKSDKIVEDIKKARVYERWLAEVLTIDWG